MSFVGLDYGSHMLKAAACDAVVDPPRLMNLGGHDSYLPSAVRFGPEAGATQCGWDAYRARRSALGDVAVGFRDAVLAKTGVVRLGKQSYDAEIIHAAQLRTLRTAVERAATHVSAFAVAIPDHWLSDRWALPVALGTVGWVPRLVVREWNAAATQLGDDDRHPLLLISLGTGGVRATLAVKRGQGWERVVTVHDEAVSGWALRRSWRDRLAEKIVRECRRDPLADPAADQALADAMEAALRELHAHPVATFRAKLFGIEMSETVSRDELRTLSAPLETGLKRLVSELLSDATIGSSAPPKIAVWGELAAILPVTHWLDTFCLRGRPAECLGLNAIANGAARLAAWWDARKQPPTAEGFAGLCPTCGRFVARWSGDACTECRTRLIPIAERLDDAPRAGPAQPEAVLTFAGDDGQRKRTPIRESSFRLGRSSLANWRFSEEQYPSVSAAHAVILWDETGYRIRDLDSMNGTLVNGMAVTECALTSGDEIRLGKTGPRLLFEL